MSTTGNTSGYKSHGRFVTVRSIKHSEGTSVILVCDGGNCHFQHSMTPTEAREIAGYLQAEANHVEQAEKVMA
jgi:Fe-S cluster biogenesis protein NfuA